ncbi:hypothetical protein C8R45DRAFT_528905 [Mycena sanguinolenta]|nr:hypothetical protein C8R45DRAFT_528905 [Mycena sanguinolenta]
MVGLSGPENAENSRLRSSTSTFPSTTSFSALVDTTSPQHRLSHRQPRRRRGAVSPSLPIRAVSSSLRRPTTQGMTTTGSTAAIRGTCARCACSGPTLYRSSSPNPRTMGASLGFVHGLLCHNCFPCSPPAISLRHPLAAAHVHDVHLRLGLSGFFCLPAPTSAFAFIFAASISTTASPSSPALTGLRSHVDEDRADIRDRELSHIEEGAAMMSACRQGRRSSSWRWRR